MKTPKIERKIKGVKEKEVVSKSKRQQTDEKSEHSKIVEKNNIPTTKKHDKYHSRDENVINHRMR